jgi:hypothetical protein
MMVFSSLTVLEQFVEDFHKHTKNVRAVAVCSLPECEHFTVADRVPKIKKELKSKHKVLFLTTYESVHKIHQALVDLKMSLDLAIFDEAHNVHTAKRTFIWGGDDKVDDDDDTSEEECSGEEAHEEEEDDDADEGEEKFAPTKGGIKRLNMMYPRRIYLTATPRDAMTKYPEVYGSQDKDWDIFTYSDLVEAQKGYDKKCVKEFDVCVTFNGKPKRGEKDPEFYDRVSVLRATLRRDAKRVMMYHSYAHKECGSRSAEHFADINAWKEAFGHLKPCEKQGRKFKDLKIYSVMGSDGKDVSEKLKDFNSKNKKIHILCSCSIFKEGVTLARCDLTVFADGKRSRRDIIQSGLRGVKYDEEKPDSRLSILLLVNLDGMDIDPNMDDTAISEAIKAGLRTRDKMEGLAAVLSSLKSENRELAEYITELAEAIKKSTTHASDVKSEEATSTLGMAPPQDVNDHAEVVNVVHDDGDDLTPVDEPKENEKADNFAGETPSAEDVGGNCNDADSAAGPSAKTLKKRSILNFEVEPEWLQWRISEASLLSVSQSLASDVVVELTAPTMAPDELWERRFAELVAYKSEHGDTNVPQGWVPNKQLATWVNRQRHKRASMAPALHQRLHTIDFAWDPEDAAWEQRFAELVAYKEQHGNTIVPRSFEGVLLRLEAKNTPLAMWVSRQRHKMERLTAARRQRLDDIGFAWDPEDAVWEQRFAELVAYKEQHGNTIVPRPWAANPQLGTWVNWQRQKMESLTAARRQRLDDIGFAWNPDDKLWERRFAELVAYKEQHGNTNVPRKWAANKQLGTWARTQMQRRNNDSMSADRHQKLEDVGFAWAVKKTSSTEIHPVQPRGGKSTRTTGGVSQKQAGRALPSTNSMQTSAQGYSSSKRKRITAKTAVQKPIIPLSSLDKDLVMGDNLADVANDGMAHIHQELLNETEGKAEVADVTSNQTAPCEEDILTQNRGPKRPRTTVSKTPTLVDASLAFQVEEQQQQCDDEASAKKRQKKNKKYDASTFSQSHTNFKNKVLAIILGKCPQGRKLSAAFLDDFTEDKSTLRTTQTLLDSGKFVANDLYCANPSQQVVDALEKKGVNGVRGVFTDACKEWDKSVQFDVAYVDLCTGSADEVLKNLDAVLPLMKPESIVAYTITGRAGTDEVPAGEHDKTWHTMGNRVTRIHAALDKAPHSYKHIAAFDRDENGSLHSPGAARAQSEIFYSDGARGARVCTGIFRRVPDRV